MDALGAHLVPLAGGFSGETFLAEAAGERSVVRIYAARGATRGPHAVEIDAAVLRLVRGLLPVPEVLEVRRADAAAGTPALLVTSHLPGRLLSEVLPEADDRLAETLGRNVGVVVSRLAQMPMPRAGEFVDADLRVGDWPERLADLPTWVAWHLEHTALGDWALEDQDRLRELAERGQDLLDHVDRVCLVHSDFNAKNLLVEPETGEVTGVLDWEFCHAGSPLSDLGNLLRFEERPAFVEAVLATYASLVPDSPHPLAAHGQAADLFALVDLAARPGENPVTDQAHELLLRRARGAAAGSPAG